MLAGIKPGTEATKLREKAHEAFAQAAAAPPGPERAALEHKAKQLDDDAGLSESYRYMQLLAGAVAIGFPIVLVGGHLCVRGFDHPLPRAFEPSLSHYYYTRLGNFFVGSLCALGLFFLSYHRKPLPGYEWDNHITTIAGFSAFGVAMLPTAFESRGVHGAEANVFHLHLFAAFLLFFLLGVLAWARFTLHGPVVAAPQGIGPRLKQFLRAIGYVLAFWMVHPYDALIVDQHKRQENRVYRGCARVIFAVIGLLALNLFVHQFEHMGSLSKSYLLVCEVCCVWSFGYAWLYKARA